jgi:predicted RNase H-like nuclease
MNVLGVDGCRAGWVAFRVDVPSLTTSVELLALPEVLKKRPDELSCIAIDIPIGLLDGPRACDKAARKLLGQPRGSSVFAAPCRATLGAQSHPEASSINQRGTERGLSRQAWGIVPKIKQVDDAITPDCQQWVLEVHPEVCFWALNQRRPMKHKKKKKEGVADRIALLHRIFPQLEMHLANRPRAVGTDDLLDAAAAAWTALRWHRNEAQCVCAPEHDEKGLAVNIYY